MVIANILLAVSLGVTGAAQAGELQLGVGLRSPLTLIDVAKGQPKAFSGGQALIRYDLGRIALEGAVHANPVAQRYTAMDQVLVLIAGDSSFQQPLTNEIATVHLLAELHPAPLEVSAWGDVLSGGLSGGPSLLMGLWGSRRAEGVLTLEPGSPDGVAYSDLGVSYNGGPALGLAVDAWFAGRAGLRVSWLSRFAVEDQPQYDPGVPSDGRQLSNHRAVSLDLMVTL